MKAVHLNSVNQKIISIMKKLLALIAFVAFMGVTVAPAYAMVSDNVVVTMNNDEEPKKNKEAKKEKKEGECSSKCSTKKSSGCENEGEGGKK